MRVKVRKRKKSEGKMNKGSMGALGGGRQQSPHPRNKIQNDYALDSPKRLK